MLALGPFRPDMADTNTGILHGLLNASLKPDGAGVAYGPLADFVALPDGGDSSTPKGHLTCVTQAGAYITFVMTATEIRRNAATGGDTTIGSGYALPAGDRWSAVQFGKYAIFTNTFNGILAYDIELGGAVAAVSGAPRARALAVIFDSLFAFDCNDDNKLILYSSINDHTNWTTGTAGYQPLPDGEELMGGAEVMDGTALVFQRNAIRILYRNDTVAMFSMRKPIAGKGAINPWCIVPVNGGAFFADSSGLCFATVEGIIPLGRGKIDQWFLTDLSTDGLATIISAYDPKREVIRSLYKKAGVDTDDLGYSGLIDFDIETKEFVPVRLPLGPAPDPEDLVQIQMTGRLADISTVGTPGYTMEELDDFGDMDNLVPNLSLDDRFWYGGEEQLGAVMVATRNDPLNATPYYPGYFTGDSLEATFETTTQSLGRRTDILEVCPVTDAAAIEIEIGAKDRLSDDIVYEEAATMDEDGIVPVYTAGRYIRLKATIPAAEEWSYFRGYEDLPGSSSVGGRG